MKISPDALNLKALYAQTEQVRDAALRGREAPRAGTAPSDKAIARPVAPSGEAERQRAQHRFTREAPTRGAQPKFVGLGQVINIVV